MKPAEVAQIHRQICVSAKCSLLDQLNYADPCAACPNGHWGRYTIAGCEDPNRPIPVAFAGSQESAVSTITRPGDILAAIIFNLTGQQSGFCGPCAARIKQMNDWGWWKCWRNRKIIVGWLCEEAAKRGHPIVEANALNLFRAALQELKRHPAP